MILAAVFLFDDRTPFPGWAALMPAAGAAAGIAMPGDLSVGSASRSRWRRTGTAQSVGLWLQHPASDADSHAERHFVSSILELGQHEVSNGSQRCHFGRGDLDLSKHLKLQAKLGNGSASRQGTTLENDPGTSLGLAYQSEY